MPSKNGFSKHWLLVPQRILDDKSHLTLSTNRSSDKTFHLKMISSCFHPKMLSFIDALISRRFLLPVIGRSNKGTTLQGLCDLTNNFLGHEAHMIRKLAFPRPIGN